MLLSVFELKLSSEILFLDSRIYLGTSLCYVPYLQIFWQKLLQCRVKLVQRLPCAD